ncbi:hypothetical protein KIV40_28685 [Vibrio sp. D173a]|uniref:hypothetical protein n=1 Tax=Vibrio sp. D173a TaxID=2836349 RepID=UPI0025534B97|nr:hypothetical protein [Vibrio sp. D173a]MDK9759209.1 hypothetical protein [Vibrio sp. D173a]
MNSSWMSFLGRILIELVPTLAIVGAAVYLLEFHLSQLVELMGFSLPVPKLP